MAIYRHKNSVYVCRCIHIRWSGAEYIPVGSDILQIKDLAPGHSQICSRHCTWGCMNLYLFKLGKKAPVIAVWPIDNDADVYISINITQCYQLSIFICRHLHHFRPSFMHQTVNRHPVQHISASFVPVVTSLLGEVNPSPWFLYTWAVPDIQALFCVFISRVWQDWLSFECRERQDFIISRDWYFIRTCKYLDGWRAKMWAYVCFSFTTTSFMIVLLQANFEKYESSISELYRLHSSMDLHVFLLLEWQQ